MKKNNTGKNTLLFCLIYVILLGVFNLLVFTIFKEKNEVFWISYGFTTLAFLVQIGSMFLSFKPADIETAFFGIPLASFSIYYLGVALGVGILFMIFQGAGWVLATVIQVLVLAAYLVIAIISILSRNVVQSVSDNVRQNVANLRAVYVEVEMAIAACQDATLKAMLKKLYETVRYSDPMSTSDVADVEQRILAKIAELRAQVDDNLVEEAKQTCTALERLYVERNKKLAMSK